ncbi:MAG TPA: acyl carrier protein [Myxococcaceae bacterium]|jgi:acyl carrier protein
MTQLAAEPSARTRADDIERKLKDWIVQHNAAAKDIGPDTNIIESRLIDSLQFVSFLLYVEELRGKEIPEDQVSLESFRSLSVIRNTFFGGP